MLKRKEYFGVTAETSPSDNWNKILSGTVLNGDIVSETNVLIEGEINGNISCSGKVHVGTTGRIKGNLVSHNAEFEGMQEGELTIENILILKSTARVKGNIETLKLNIEEGAFFEGSCVMKSPISKTSFSQEVNFE